MKQFLKKVVVFSISFLIGIFVSYLYNSSKISTGVEQNPNIETRSTLFNPPEPMKCNPDSLGNLINRSRAIKNWIKNNPNAPKDKLEAKSKEDLELERRIIEELEDTGKQTDDDGGASDLLYKCDESRWKNLRPGN